MTRDEKILLAIQNKARKLFSIEIIQAVDFLLSILKNDSEKYSQLLSLKNTIFRVNRDFLKGIIQHSEYELSRNRKNDEIISLIYNIGKNDISKGAKRLDLKIDLSDLNEELEKRNSELEAKIIQLRQILKEERDYKKTLQDRIDLSVPLERLEEEILLLSRIIMKMDSKYYRPLGENDCTDCRGKGFTYLDKDGKIVEITSFYNFEIRKKKILVKGCKKCKGMGKNNIWSF
jgi:hypothetical protein